MNVENLGKLVVLNLRKFPFSQIQPFLDGMKKDDFGYVVYVDDDLSLVDRIAEMSTRCVPVIVDIFGNAESQFKHHYVIKPSKYESPNYTADKVLQAIS